MHMQTKKNVTCGGLALVAGQVGWLHVGYSPVCVFLSRAQFFCNEWPGSLHVYVRINYHELIDPTYSASVHFLMTWLLVATE